MCIEWSQEAIEGGLGAGLGEVGGDSSGDSVFATPYEVLMREIRSIEKRRGKLQKQLHQAEEAAEQAASGALRLLAGTRRDLDEADAALREFYFVLRGLRR